MASGTVRQGVRDFAGGQWTLCLQRKPEVYSLLNWLRSCPVVFLRPREPSVGPDSNSCTHFYPISCWRLFCITFICFKYITVLNIYAFHLFLNRGYSSRLRLVHVLDVTQSCTCICWVNYVHFNRGHKDTKIYK